MKKQLILLIVLIVIGAGILTGCQEQSSNSGYIQIVSHNIRDSWANAIEVYGTVKNVVDINVDYAEVTIKFYERIMNY